MIYLLFCFVVYFSAADPGAVQTNIMREVPSFLSHATFVVLKLLGLLQSPNDGVSSILDAALAPPVSSPRKLELFFLYWPSCLFLQLQKMIAVLCNN